MNLAYLRYPAPRRVEEYQGQTGSEVGGSILPGFVYEAIAAAKTSGNPCQYTVTGEWRREDGVRYLHFGVTRDYIETVTNYRDTASGLRWTCPDCGLVGGKHHRTCGYN